ncbi:hemolymph juvenile hormone binding [Trinorchestia longiramus]|nr:hemolymph juvenile hormone binding [Trinorchestia longiramus]
MWASFKTGAVILLCMQVVSGQNFIDLVRNCKNHIERLNECIVQSVMKVQPRMAEGISELNLPKLEPLYLGSFNMTQSQGPVNFRADFSDLTVTGLSRLDLKYLDVNYANRSVHMGCTLPGLNIRGKYDVNGRIFELPVQGQGPFLALLEGIVATGFGTMNSRDGVVYSLDTMKLDVKIQKFRSKVENLFGGNEVLQNTLTHFMEENSNLVLEEVRPGLTNNFDSFLTQVLNTVLSQMPVDVMTTIPNANIHDKHRARTLRVLGELN